MYVQEATDLLIKSEYVGRGRGGEVVRQRGEVRCWAQNCNVNKHQNSMLMLISLTLHIFLVSNNVNI